MVLQYILPRFCTPQNSPLPAVTTAFGIYYRIVTTWWSSASQLFPSRAQAAPMPLITGQYIDPLMTVKGNMGGCNTVDYAVGKLRTDVVIKVNDNFQLDLDPTMMEARIFPSGDVFAIWKIYSMFNWCTCRIEKPWYSISPSRRHPIHGPVWAR